jgi:hypothetical protein
MYVKDIAQIKGIPAFQKQIYTNLKISHASTLTQNFHHFYISKIQIDLIGVSETVKLLMELKGQPMRSNHLC